MGREEAPVVVKWEGRRWGDPHFVIVEECYGREVGYVTGYYYLWRSGPALVVGDSELEARFDVIREGEDVYKRILEELRELVREVCRKGVRKSLVVRTNDETIDRMLSELIKEECPT